jgi:uncharacterized membrane protein
VDALTEALMSIGGAVCHQNPDRGLFGAASPLPLCARCFGLHTGLWVGLIVWVGHRARHTRPSTPVLTFAALAVIATGATLVGARLAPGADAAWLRALTGAGLGYALAAVVAPLTRNAPASDDRGGGTRRLALGAAAAMGMPLAVALTPTGPWLEGLSVLLGLLGPASVVLMWRALLGGLWSEAVRSGPAWLTAFGLAALQIGATLWFKGTWD